MKIVIVGGGFAGINMAKKLADNEHTQVVLVDKNNYHFFPPLIYQVATSFIEASNISYPFRKLFQHKKNLRFHYGALLQVVQDENKIITTSGEVTYDKLVLALGTETNYFGMQNVQKHAIPMKTINNALDLRNHLLQVLEKAALTNDKHEKEKLLNIVIAGGGPTGVELAGMMAYMGKHIVKKDYPDLPAARRANIYLVDMLPVLLGPMSRKSQSEAYNVLDSMGVKVKLNSSVKDYVNDEVVFGDGTTIPTYSLIWASGVIACEAPGLPKESIGKGRRIMVDAFNKVNGTTNIYAIGDVALQTTDTAFPNGHPQLAQVAIQHGQLLAQNLAREQKGQPMKPFIYNDKGSMAIISKNKAVVDLSKNVFLKGFFAWLIWLFIHILPIAGFRNKLKLLNNWIWSFISNDPNLRLIIRPKNDWAAGTKQE
ncbi:NADH dehydrogenase [Filimonas lacunae]|uniref:NADH:ubiquinone reductase (non-electrogenic) n=1 Tax=Filimonas lacunae TaxID=477680 RepID=A0A173MLM6_9BACT|nr:NAD(P)/FAD-dependent oxidoreductase [Filimonas lacunae]BAV08370.1 NADH dehydrogenase [Filimonas lacunae]SIT33465.1 NADH dehydrogenase [Filimonas lacunae]